jgi:hypothetical protein
VAEPFTIRVPEELPGASVAPLAIARMPLPAMEIVPEPLSTAPLACGQTAGCQRAVDRQPPGGNGGRTLDRAGSRQDSEPLPDLARVPVPVIDPA